MYIYKAKCERVVDGDTIDATIDLGFDTWKKIRIRLVGINAAESRTRDLEEKARLLIKENYTQEFTSKIVKIYMAHNRNAYGGNFLPLEVAVELAAVELGIIKTK